MSAVRNVFLPSSSTTRSVHSSTGFRHPITFRSITFPPAVRHSSQCQFFFFTVSLIFQKFCPVIVPFSYKSLQFDVPVVIELDPGAQADQIDLLTPTIAFMSPSMTYVRNSSFVSIFCLLENRFSLSITFLSRPKVGGLDAWTCVITGHTIVFV